MIQTSGRWKVAQNVDFTSDILSYLRILHIKAVSRNLTFFHHASSWNYNLTLTYVVSSSERQPHWIPKRYGKERKKQITVFIDNVYVRDSFIDCFFLIKVPSKPKAKPMAIER